MKALAALLSVTAACFDVPPRPLPVDADTRADDASDTTDPDALDATDGDAAPETLTPSSEVVVSVGREHVCALVRGEGLCWGDGGDGRLGDLSATPGVVAPTRVRIARALTSIASGAHHTCATFADSGACWGLNDRQQVAAAATPQWSPRDVGARALSLGADTTCLLAADVAGVRCRGEPLDGLTRTPRIDDDVETGPSWIVPHAIPGVTLTPTRDHIAIGTSFGCAIDGVVRCWGSNAFGELGREPPVADPSPAAVADLPLSAVEVAAGSSFACARGALGEVACWGDNRRFQIGSGVSDGTLERQATPALVPLLRPAIGLALGRRHACALLDDRHVTCWGDNSNGQLGVDDTSATPTPVQVDIDDVIALDAGWATTCAARSDGSVWCWGDDAHGQLGRGVAGLDFNATPRAIDLAPAAPRACNDCAPITLLEAGDDHTCALSDDTAWCWGRGDGRLGRGLLDLPIGAPFPTGLGDTLALALGTTRTCGLDAAGAVWCSGDDVTLPSAIALPRAIAVRAAGHRACAITEAGEVWCWGADRVPTRVATDMDTDSPRIALGVDATCARARSGPLRPIVCWGANARGQLGRGGFADDPEPAPVALDEAEVIDDLAGADRRFCVVTNESLHCWGSNDRAALGLGYDHVATPALIPLPGAVTAVALGLHATCAVADHEVYCWGDNSALGLGLPDVAVVTEPHRVRLDFVADHVAVGLRHACAASRDGHLACWGDDAHGQLGGGRAGPASATPRALALTLDGPGP